MNNQSDGYIDIMIQYKDVGDKYLITILNVINDSNIKLRPEHIKCIMQTLVEFARGRYITRTVYNGRLVIDQGSMSFHIQHIQPAFLKEEDWDYDLILDKRSGHITKHTATKYRAALQEAFGI